MSHPLFDHVPGCTILDPCSNCKAVKFLQENLDESHFNAFVRLIGRVESATKDRDVNESSVDLNSVVTKKIEELGLPARVNSRLLMNDVQYVGDIIKTGGDELSKIPGFGRKALNETVYALERLGLNFNTKLPEGWDAGLPR